MSAESRDIKGGFDPDVFRPTKRDDVLLFDRGEHADPRYVLMREGADGYLNLTADDKQIWDMMDGESTVI